MNSRRTGDRFKNGLFPLDKNRTVDSDQRVILQALLNGLGITGLRVSQRHVSLDDLVQRSIRIAVEQGGSHVRQGLALVDDFKFIEGLCIRRLVAADFVLETGVFEQKIVFGRL